MMFTDFGTIFAFMLLAVGFVLLNILIAKVLSRTIKDPIKLMPYECGVEPESPAWVRFNPRFLMVALLFLVFDVEAALLFPVVTVFRGWAETGAGWFVLAEVFIFLLILFVALIYAWRKGDLQWMVDSDG